MVDTRDLHGAKLGEESQAKSIEAAKEIVEVHLEPQALLEKEEMIMSNDWDHLFHRSPSPGAEHPCPNASDPCHEVSLSRQVLSVWKSPDS